MADEVSEAIGRLAQWAFTKYLAPRLPDDPELTAAVAVLARHLASRLDGLPAIPAPPPPPVPPPPPAPPLPPAVPLSQLPKLDIGSQYQPPVPQQPHYFEGERELDLLPPSVVADRCRLKGEACTLIAKRIANPSDWNDAKEDELHQRAQALPDCHLWMLAREPMVSSQRAWEDLAGAYNTAAEAVLMMRDWEQAPPLAIRHARAYWAWPPRA
ncbi:MAG: hypothetical protein U0791_05810 [Gemmataceae bacterium]